MPRHFLAAPVAALAALVLAVPAAAQDAVPCAPASQPAALLEAPERLAYGRTGRARVVGGPGEAVVERALIQVGDAPPSAGAARFAQVLDDPPLRLRLLTTEVLPTGRCERVAEHLVRGFRRIAVPTGCSASVVRPRRFDECTVDWGWRARRLRWRGYNQDVARAPGRYLPGCPPSPWATCTWLPARFTLSRIRFCGSLDAYVYTRMRARPRGERRVDADLRCPPLYPDDG
jgi:hypothetical protein